MGLTLWLRIQRLDAARVMTILGGEKQIKKMQKPLDGFRLFVLARWPVVRFHPVSAFYLHRPVRFHFSTRKSN